MFQERPQTICPDAPALTDDALERLAEALLRAFGMDLQKPSALDVDSFAQNHLGVRQVFYCLSPDGAYDCAYVSQDTDRLPIYGSERGQPRYVRAGAYTLALESALLRHEPEYRFAVAHGCGHAVLHREIGMPFFLCADTLNAAAPLEQQATHFALALLMPRQAVYILTAGMNARGERSESRAIGRMAEVFQVPRAAAAFRLRALGGSRNAAV